MKHVGNCFCGAVTIEVTGDAGGDGLLPLPLLPLLVGRPGQRLQPVEAGAVQITEGAENVETFQKTPLSQRKYCKKCGGHLMTNHPPLGLIDVFTATIPTLDFTPASTSITRRRCCRCATACPS